MLTKAQKEQWLIDLRSGNFKQGFGYLKNINEEYCCLGVLIDRFNFDASIVSNNYCFYFPNGLDSRTTIPNSILLDETKLKLVRMNDDEMQSFADIADWIELNVTTSD